MKNRTMKILISGSSGFAGNVLRKELIRKGFYVTGIVGKSSPRKGEISLDIRTSAAFDSLKDQRYDVIIHAAAVIDGGQKKLIRQVNENGTRNIVDYAHKINCKHFIHISSTGVFGIRSMGENIKENALRSGIGSAYTWTKRKAEKIVEKSGLSYTILRLPILLGRGDTYLSPAVMSSILLRKPFYVNRKKKMVSLLYIKNLPMIIEKLIHTGPLNKSVLCTDSEMYWEDLLHEYSQYSYLKPLKIHTSFLPALLSGLFDRNILLTALLGGTGMHFNNSRLIKTLDIKHFPYHWKDGVREAVENFLKTNKILNSCVVQ